MSDREPTPGQVDKMRDLRDDPALGLDPPGMRLRTYRALVDKACVERVGGAWLVSAWGLLVLRQAALVPLVVKLGTMSSRCIFVDPDVDLSVGSYFEFFDRDDESPAQRPRSCIVVEHRADLVFVSF